MVEEIKLVRDLGLSGVVIGAGDATGLDWQTIQTLCVAADGLNITLHRVVDLLPERHSILKQLAEIGINRVLTSGGATSVFDQIADIRSLIAEAPNGLIIMPGSGVTPNNIQHIINVTKAKEIHASASEIVQNTTPVKSIELGFESHTFKQTSGKTVRLLKSKSLDLV